MNVYDYNAEDHIVDFISNAEEYLSTVW